MDIDIINYALQHDLFIKPTDPREVLDTALSRFPDAPLPCPDWPVLPTHEELWPLSTDQKASLKHDILKLQSYSSQDAPDLPDDINVDLPVLLPEPLSKQWQLPDKIRRPSRRDDWLYSPDCSFQNAMSSLRARQDLPLSQCDLDEDACFQTIDSLLCVKSIYCANAC